MKLPFYIARRYLFSKKSHNAINIVSAISAGGVLVGTMALVCVLSVFNGFGSVVEGLFSAFDPDLKITLVQGKSFSVEENEIQAVREMKEVICFTEVLQENAMLRYKDKQTPGVVKGVSDDFSRMTNIKQIIVAGNFLLHDNAFNYGVAGLGLAGTLGVAPYFSDPVYIYAPRRDATINLADPTTGFSTDYAFVSAVFSVQQPEYDEKMFIVPIEMTRELYQYPPDAVTNIELKIDSTADFSAVKERIGQTLGTKFKVLDRYEQQEDYFRIMKVEKWIAFFILGFILLIAIFNIIGSLSMLIIDKTDDIRTLRNLGASEQLIRQIFLFEGWLISLLGAIIGIAVGSALCLLQQHFGFIQLPGSENFAIKAYPVLLEWSDVLAVLVTVCVMGFVAAWYPVRQIKIERESV
ncbi:MAG: FtsX-like permease family protein [Prevotellaceae bacterium]|jgi:lipoprotein-releasing system permease protein|nr:FtsX-like permease family protein [Prevotellaceae bacterium]